MTDSLPDSALMINRVPIQRFLEKHDIDLTGTGTLARSSIEACKQFTREYVEETLEMGMIPPQQFFYITPTEYISVRATAPKVALSSWLLPAVRSLALEFEALALFLVGPFRLGDDNGEDIILIRSEIPSETPRVSTQHVLVQKRGGSLRASPWVRDAPELMRNRTFRLIPDPTDFS